MADQNAKSSMVGIKFGTQGYSRVFEDADHESELYFHKFKMANPTWLTNLSPEIFWFDALLSRKRFIKF